MKVGRSMMLAVVSASVLGYLLAAAPCWAQKAQNQPRQKQTQPVKKQNLRDWMNERTDQATGQKNTPGRNAPADVVLGKKKEKEVYGPANDKTINQWKKSKNKK